MSCPKQHDGYLSLDLVCHNGRTAIASQRSRPPLQTFGLQEADGHGSAYLQILNPCGGLFEGDHAEIEVSLQSGAHLYLTTQAATKVYPSENGQLTRQRIRLRVAGGAILEYFPLPLIPFARALYAQEIDIRVKSDGICLVAEVLAPGRSARGERFAYQMVRSRVEGWMDNRLALFEQLRLQPKQSPIAGVGILDGQSYRGHPVCVDLTGPRPMDPRLEPPPDRALRRVYRDHRPRPWRTGGAPPRTDRTGSATTLGCGTSPDS